MAVSGGDISWQHYNLQREASLRGIAAVDAETCWVGGSQSTLARTVDGGKSWHYFMLTDSSNFEFRDIHAFDKNSVIVMSAGEGTKSKLFKTTDGGKSWRIVYENSYPQGFFNGIAFWNDKEGILTGDPIDGKLFILTTRDGGETWQRVTALPEVVDGEYGFAASGSHITVSGTNVWIGTGGSAARVFYSPDKGKTWTVVNTPMLQGEPSQGIFSLAFSENGKGIAVGGDYTQEEGPGTGNVIYSNNNGKTWQRAEDGQMPFRSAVRFVKGKILITGPSGSAYSDNNGHTWKPIKGKGFHTLDVTHNGVVWAAGSEGRIGKIIFE